MSRTEDKKTLNENTNVPTQAVNPAMMVKSPELPTKVEFCQDASKKNTTMATSKKSGTDVK